MRRRFLILVWFSALLPWAGCTPFPSALPLQSEAGASPSPPPARIDGSLTGPPRPMRDGGGLPPLLPPPDATRPRPDASPPGPSPPPRETCNGEDEDGDGAIDEGIQPQGDCDAGCGRTGRFICRDGELVCSPPEGNEEVCNGLDDDCDDEIDEGGLCAARFLDSCTVWLGWTAVEGAGIPPNHRDAQANWAACPTMPSENDSETATCTRAGRDGEFQGLNVGTGTLGLYDYLAVALTCDQGDPLARWMQSHCTAYIGQSDVPNFATPSARWAECPDSDESADLIERSICTSSARDGQFHSMRVIGLVDLTDRFAVALKCTPRGQPDPNVGDPSAVASAIESGVELVLGWAPSTPAQVNGRLEWLYPCLTDQEQDFGSPPEGNCVSSTGDGQFHGSWVGNRGPANAPTVFGIALRALQD